jgi:hypothetical protein
MRERIPSTPSTPYRVGRQGRRHSRQALEIGLTFDRVIGTPDPGPNGPTTIEDVGATSCRRQPSDHPSLGCERRRKGGVVDMAISVWAIVVVACCALCAKGIKTAVRRSRERHAQAASH